MPPKRKRGGAAPGTATGTSTPLDAGGEASVLPSGAQTPAGPSLAERLSYLHEPRPFKNPAYTKNVNRRAKNLKTVLNAERERVKSERERRKAEGEVEEEEDTSYTSIEAPPSVMPHPHYCDITGLEGPYTHPATRLRYHDKDVYEIVKNLNPTTARDYLALRGVMPIVK